MTRKFLKTALITTSMIMGSLAFTGPSFAGEASQAEKMAMKESSMMKAENAALNAPFNEFLSKYVVTQNDMNLVAYGKVTEADEASLETYIETLSNLDITGFSDAEIMAYWFNLYNAKTIDVILDEYPIKSIRKIGFLGPWKKKNMVVRGEKMSLDDIEHGTIRATYDEPRIHFAFNCASIGCPDLKETAWEAETLEADLTVAAQKYVNSPRGFDVSEEGQVKASSLFKWYKDDFGGTQKDVIAYLAQFAKGETKAVLETATEIDSYIYDWDLNAPK